MAKKAKKSKKVKSDKLEQAKMSLDAAELEAQAAPVPAAEKSAAVKKAPAKKTPAKKAAAKKPGRKPMTAAEKAENAKARAEAKQKAANMTPTLTLQYGGRDVNVRALVQAAKDEFKAQHKRTPLTELDLYLKPEDGALYYVANGKTAGKVLF